MSDENNQPPQADDAKAEFSNLEEQSVETSGVEDEAVKQIPVTLSVEVGRSDISIQDLLQLNQGSVVQLDRAAGEPMDIRVNGCLMAHGEVVVVNDQFGVRLTSIVSPRERANRVN